MNYKFFNELTNECKYIREEVFIKEQNFIDEFDEIDNFATHVIVFIEDLPAATGRLYKDFEDNNCYHIGRIAVLKEHRKHKLGTLLINILEEKAKELGANTFTLSAQLRVKSFYEKLGYTPIGTIYYEEYCEHIKMVKSI